MRGLCAKGKGDDDGAWRRDASVLLISTLTAHPARYPVSPESRREAQACRAHGKVADEVPEQTENLDGGCHQREDGGSDL